MIRLYLSDNMLRKSAGLPKTPGAATSGSGPQVVDCPLGAACPDGGKHQMGSQKLQEHTAQAQQKMQTGQTPGDESAGKETGNPAVPPGASNIGGVGSDKAEVHNPLALANRTDRPVVGAHGAAFDHYRNAALAQGTPEADQHLQNARASMDALSDDKHADMVRRLKNAGMHKEAAYQEDQMRQQQEAMAAMNPKKGKKGKKTSPVEPPDRSSPAPGLTPVNDEEGNLSHYIKLKNNEPHEFDPNGNPIEYDASGKPLGQPHGPYRDANYDYAQEQAAAKDKDKGWFQESRDEEPTTASEVGQFERQEVPNPMAGDKSAVPANSKPMDHYKLAQVARDSGDEELANFHEGLAKERMRGAGSEDHRALADELHKEGMHDQAAYHRGVYDRVQGSEDSARVAGSGFLDRKEAEDAQSDQGKAALEKLDKQAGDAEASKKHEAGMRDVHHEQRSKATQDLLDAQQAHEDLKAKAESLKQKNKEALDKYEQAKAEHAKAKSAGKKPGAAPKKPKLEKEEKVPEKPELARPSNEHEKLVHGEHTERARKVAEIAESHLKNNPNLSAGDRKRLERAHEMAVYHQNVGYTPTAAHKKELGDAEKVVSGMGLKDTHENMQAAEDQKQVASAEKQMQKDAATKQKFEAKQQAAQQKQQAKAEAAQAKAQPKPPQSTMDQVRVADHASRAQKLQQQIQEHLDNNMDMTPDERAKGEQIIQELDKHSKLDMVPGADHANELKELTKLAGPLGKQYKPPSDGEYGGGMGGGGMGSTNAVGTNADRTQNRSGTATAAFNSGRHLGAGLAAAATSPTGGAGKIGTQVIDYGTSGVVAAGHHLLHHDGETGLITPRSGTSAPTQGAKE